MTTQTAFVSHAHAVLINARQNVVGAAAFYERGKIAAMSPKELVEALREAGVWESFREQYDIFEAEGALWDLEGPLEFLESD